MTFTIDAENNIMAFRSQAEAEAIRPQAETFASEQELAKLATTWPARRLVEIAAPFGLARRLTRQPARKLNDELLSTTLKVLSGLASDRAMPRANGVPPLIWEACRELQSERETNHSWRMLVEAGMIPDQVLSELRGPREHRLRAFERILKSPQRPDTLITSFLAGLLADQLSPGSLGHVDLLLPYLNQYPTALMWYGLCAGLHPDSEVQQVGNCLGRRLVRDLLTPDPILAPKVRHLRAGTRGAP